MREEKRREELGTTVDPSTRPQKKFLFSSGQILQSKLQKHCKQNVITSSSLACFCIRKTGSEPNTHDQCANILKHAHTHTHYKVWPSGLIICNAVISFIGVEADCTGRTFPPLLLYISHHRMLLLQVAHFSCQFQSCCESMKWTKEWKKTCVQSLTCLLWCTVKTRLQCQDIKSLCQNSNPVDCQAFGRDSPCSLLAFSALRTCRSTILVKDIVSISGCKNLNSNLIPLNDDMN